MSVFTPHSTRDASTSAVVGGIPTDTILKTAGWSSDNVFRKFYRREITNDSSFSKFILKQKWLDIWDLHIDVRPFTMSKDLSLLHVTERLVKTVIRKFSYKFKW